MPRAREKRKARRQDKTIKTNTYPAFFRLVGANEETKEAPTREEIIAWLSLDGRLNFVQKRLKIITVKNTAQAPFKLFLPRLDMEKTNSATE